MAHATSSSTHRKELALRAGAGPVTSLSPIAPPDWGKGLEIGARSPLCTELLTRGVPGNSVREEEAYAPEHRYPKEQTEPYAEEHLFGCVVRTFAPVVSP